MCPTGCKYALDVKWQRPLTDQHHFKPKETCSYQPAAALEWCVCMQDFSDLVAQKAAQQKRKAAQAKESGKSKKQKSDTFKF